MSCILYVDALFLCTPLSDLYPFFVLSESIENIEMATEWFPFKNAQSCHIFRSRPHLKTFSGRRDSKSQSHLFKSRKFFFCSPVAHHRPLSIVGDVPNCHNVNFPDRYDNVFTELYGNIWPLNSRLDESFSSPIEAYLKWIPPVKYIISLHRSPKTSHCSRMRNLMKSQENDLCPADHLRSCWQLLRGTNTFSVWFAGLRRWLVYPICSTPEPFVHIWIFNEVIWIIHSSVQNNGLNMRHVCSQLE